MTQADSQDEQTDHDPAGFEQSVERLSEALAILERKFTDKLSQAEGQSEITETVRRQADAASRSARDASRGLSDIIADARALRERLQE